MKNNKVEKLLVTSATSFELVPFMEYLEQHGSKKSFFEYQLKGISIFPLVTGVGAMSTAFALSRYNDIKEIDFAINLGIAGAFNRDFDIGASFQVDRDCFGDIGVEESNGSFMDVFDLELMNASSFPFAKKWMNNDTKQRMKSDLPTASSLTVNCVSGTAATIHLRKEKYNADLETMEGAAFAYACKMMQVDYLQLRAVSNFVEPRNKANWNLDLAIHNVNTVLIQLIQNFYSPV